LGVYLQAGHQFRGRRQAIQRLMGRHGGDHRTRRQAAGQAPGWAGLYGSLAALTWAAGDKPPPYRKSGGRGMALLLTKQDTAGLMDMERAIKVLESAMI